VACEEGLVARIPDGVGPGDQPGNLPRLEFALTQLTCHTRLEHQSTPIVEEENYATLC
jgi:hypothetical protein